MNSCRITGNDVASSLPASSSDCGDSITSVLIGEIGLVGFAINGKRMPAAAGASSARSAIRRVFG